jgi:hypothetical protein
VPSTGQPKREWLGSVVGPPLRITTRYAGAVGLHAGRVSQGAIVLEDAADLEEGASVTIWIERSHEVVSVTDEELELVRRGQAEAARGECVDMRQALQRLRTGG